MRSKNVRRARRGALLAVGSLAASMMVALPGTAAAQDATDVTVLTFNDFHGRISQSRPSTVAFADTIQKMRAEHEGAALTSAGDNVGASLFASSFKEDKPTLDVLNALGLQASAVGNHEFDRGVADLQKRIEEAADFPYLAANVTVNGEQMQEYEILDVNGIKVGFVGAVTDSTPSLVSPTGITGVEFGDPVAAVNRVAGDLKDGDASNGEADIVVASYHEGAATDADLATAEAATDTFSKIVNDTADSVDAIFNGHTHYAYNWEKNGRPIIQTGSYGENIGRVTFSVNPETKEISSIDTELRKVPSDAANVDLNDPVTAKVKEIVDNAIAEAQTVGEQPVGAVDGDITRAASGDGRNDDRLSESALGNLVADFMVDAVQDRGGAQIAFMNPGGLRDDLLNDPAYSAGSQNITLAEANAVLPFANTLMTMDMTGEQIKKVLEQQWQPEGNDRPFLALGTNTGFTWTFDPSRAAGDRITGVFLDGKALDPAATYKVATQSFLAGGGDNFTEFSNATNKADTGLVDSESWMDYMEKQGVLSPSDAKHAVVAKDLPTTITAGEETTFTLADLNLTSLGAKLAQSGTVTLDGNAVGSVTVSQEVTSDDAFFTPLDGSATVTVNLPESARNGESVLKVEFDNGTVAYVPVAVTGGTDAPVDENPSTGSLGSLADGGLVSMLGVAGLIAAIAVGGQIALANGAIPPSFLAMLPQPVKDFLNI